MNFLSPLTWPGVAADPSASAFAVSSRMTETEDNGRVSGFTGNEPSTDRSEPDAEVTWICRECGGDGSRGDVTFSFRVRRKHKRLTKKNPKTTRRPLCVRCTKAETDEKNHVLKPSKSRFTTDSDVIYTTRPVAMAHVRGIAYYRSFLSDEEASLALDTIDKNPWRNVIAKRRQQFYGATYYHTTNRNRDAQPHNETEGALDIRQWDWLARKLQSKTWRARVFGNAPFPKQILINEYVGCTGISTHFEDEEAFGPVIATISLISPILMTLEHPRVHTNECTDMLEPPSKVLLEPRSLFMMSESARYEWRHGISRHRIVPLPNGSVVARNRDSYRRVSITIRHLREGRRRCPE